MMLRFVLMLLPWAVPMKDVDKSGFYAVMASRDIKEVESQLNTLETLSFPEKDAYVGTLLMKKAGLLTLPKDKLKNFRLGCTKLETAISRDSTNAEYRFLRLSIQEHAPRIVKYSADLPRDKAFIELHFKSLPPVVQDAVREYSKHSHILHPESM